MSRNTSRERRGRLRNELARLQEELQNEKTMRVHAVSQWKEWCDRAKTAQARARKTDLQCADLTGRLKAAEGYQWWLERICLGCLLSTAILLAWEFLT